MGHLVNAKGEVYRALAERLHKQPLGAHVNESLMEILYRLYTESEAMVGSKFSLAPMTLAKIARITGIKEAGLKEILDNMANKGLVQDLHRRDNTYYILTPMIVGFFEFTFMRARDEVNMQELAELFQQYFRDPAVWEEFAGSEIKLFQTLVYENVIPAVVQTEVLSYERASEIIRQSGGGALSLCACRHIASHQGKACEMNAPLEVCTSLGDTAAWLVRRGMGRTATVDELLQVLEHTHKLGLVHLGDNILNQPAYICHCCGCCCEALFPTKEYGVFFTQPSNFTPVVAMDRCTGCGICASRCQVKAVTMRDAGHRGQIPDIYKQICIGCGICANACPSGSLTMSRRPDIHVPPKNNTARLRQLAGEKGS